MYVPSSTSRIAAWNNPLMPSVFGKDYATLHYITRSFPGRGFWRLPWQNAISGLFVVHVRERWFSPSFMAFGGP